MKETMTKSQQALAELVKLRETINVLHDQAVTLEALAREAYAQDIDTDRHNAPGKLPDAGAYALARIAVLEAENAAQREQIIRLTAALDYGQAAPQTP